VGSLSKVGKDFYVWEKRKSKVGLLHNKKGIIRAKKFFRVNLKSVKEIPFPPKKIVCRQL